MKYVGKQRRAGKATDDNTAHAHFILGTRGYKHNHRIQRNNSCSSTAKCAAQMRLSVTLDVHYLSCSQ